MRIAIRYAVIGVRIVIFAGCGRVEFDPLVDGGGSSGIVCPAGFVAVAGNAALGTANFCVMQFEAKAWQDADADGVVVDSELDGDGCGVTTCDADWGAGTHLPAGVAQARPWRSVRPTTAQAACAALGAGFDLIANREWMTIARDAELVAANWTTGVIGDGRMIEGHTDSTGAFYIAVSDPSDPYSDTGNSELDPPDTGREQRRTLELSNGSIVWDLPGNTQEWIDWTIGAPYDPPPSCATAELPAVSCAGLVDEDYNSSTGTYSSANGVGIVIGGSGNAARRGGQTPDRPMNIAGIYALNMNRNTTNVFSGTGFRCVYRPL